MITADINKLELTEFTAPTNPGQRCKATFPLLGVMGTKQTACVYIELDPGEELGSHTDSAEEVLFVIEGEAEITVNDEKTAASVGQMAVVPKLDPHNIRNTGSTKARLLGFFGGANNIVAKFEHEWQPIGSNEVSTAAMV